MAVIDEVRQILGNVLQLGGRVASLDENSGLLGVIPELDSMAVISVITVLEENYGFVIEDDEVDAEVFETLGSLAAFVEQKCSE